jgi:hypothetical protein
VGTVELEKRFGWSGRGTVGHNSALGFLCKTAAVDSYAVHNQLAVLDKSAVLDYGIPPAAAMYCLSDRSAVSAHKVAEMNDRAELVGNTRPLSLLEGWRRLAMAQPRC